MKNKPNSLEPFIFTEIVRCGQIAKIALRSFYTFHPEAIVHVYGLSADRGAVEEFPHVIFHDLNKFDFRAVFSKGFIKDRLKRIVYYRRIANNFNQGHLGTASLWAYLIQTRPERYMMHFDSDVVFRAAVLPDFKKQIQKKFDLIGPVRNYKNNPHKDDAKRVHPDVTQTYCFAFNRELVSYHRYPELVEMCRGGYNPLGFEVIDFFDPVGFEILHNKGRRYILSVDDYGGEGPLGNRENKHPQENHIIDFGDKIAHFSGVGSGMNFFHNKDSIKGVPDSYVDHGLRRYAMYMKLFYNQDVMKSSDIKDYKAIFKVKNWY